MTKFRKGDVVTVEGVVSTNYDLGGKIKIRIEPYTDEFVAAESLTMKCPVFAVGDKVIRPEAGYRPATVLAIADDHLWVSIGDGDYATWRSSLCQRVDDEPPVEVVDEAPPASETAP